MALPLGFTGARLDRADQVRVDAERFAAVVADPRALCLALDGIDFVPGEGGGLHWEPFDPADTRAPMLLGIDEAGVPHFVREPAPGQRIDASSRTVMRTEEHTSELQSLMRRTSAVFSLKIQNKKDTHSKHTAMQ